MQDDSLEHGKWSSVSYRSTRDSMGRASPRWAVQRQNIKLTPPHLCEVVPYKNGWGSVGSSFFCLLIVVVDIFGCAPWSISVLTWVSFRCGSWWLSEEPRWTEYTAVSPWRGLVFQYGQRGSVTDRVNSLVWKLRIICWGSKGFNDGYK